MAGGHLLRINLSGRTYLLGGSKILAPVIAAFINRISEVDLSSIQQLATVGYE